MSCRLDKFVWFVRLCKTRTLATELVQKGKVKLNGSGAKPSIPFLSLKIMQYSPIKSKIYLIEE